MATKLLLFASTRPEAIKLAPVARALDRLGQPARTIVLGQQPGATAAAFAEHGCPVDLCLPAVAHPLPLRCLSAVLHDQVLAVLAH